MRRSLAHRALKLDPLRLPRAGSRLRIAYDELAAGLVVNLTTVAGKRAAEVLRDDYNCELDTKRGSSGGTQLLGRWDGVIFVPLERLGHGVAS